MAVWEENKAKRVAKAAARARTAAIQMGENAWRAEIERLRAENKKMRAETFRLRLALSRLYWEVFEVGSSDEALEQARAALWEGK